MTQGITLNNQSTTADALYEQVQKRQRAKELYEAVRSPTIARATCTDSRYPMTVRVRSTGRITVMSEDAIPLDPETILGDTARSSADEILNDVIVKHVYDDESLAQALNNSRHVLPENTDDAWVPGRG